MPRVRLSMDCIERVWESLGGGLRCQFWGTVQFTMTSLVHPKTLPRVMEAMIEWKQTTPARFDSDSSTPVLRTSSKFKKDPEEDLEEDLEPVEDEDLVNGPERTLSSEPAEDASESSHRWRLEWLANRYQPWSVTPSTLHAISYTIMSKQRNLKHKTSNTGKRFTFIKIPSIKNA